MKLRIVFSRLLSAIILGLFFACSNGDGPGMDDINNCVEGRGAIVSEVRDFPIFTAIQSNLVGDIIIQNGPEYEMRLEAQQNIINLINTEVTNEKLVIEVARCFENASKITAYITLPELSEISLSGVGNIAFADDFNPDLFNVLLEGVGNITMRGSANELNMVITGVGTIRAFDIPTGTCTVTITGEGTAEVFVNNQLNVTITGSGTVFYKGNPTITTDINGIGEVINAN